MHCIKMIKLAAGNAAQLQLSINEIYKNMLTGISSKIAEKGDSAIMAASHLLDLVQQALHSHNVTLIALPGRGEITIVPHLRQYHANTSDIAAFCAAPVASFEIRQLDHEDAMSISAPAKDIRELQWQLAFYLYEDSLIPSCSENDVIEFTRWPNLTRLPVTPNTARICALLTRHPTSITLIRRVLGIDRHEVNRVISAAYSAGIVNMVSRGPSATTITETETEEIKPATQKTGLWNSLFSKISSL